MNNTLNASPISILLSSINTRERQAEYNDYAQISILLSSINTFPVSDNAILNPSFLFY